MKQLKVAILGQGRSGRDIHGEFFIKSPEKFKIVAVVDPLEERRKRAENEYGCETYGDYRRLLNRHALDLVVNSTPSHLHVPVTLEFLKGGFNVLCEKPLAKKVAEVDMLIQTAEKSGKILAIFQQSRFAPYFQKIREVINSGVLGRIVQIGISFSGFGRRWDWQTLQEYNGGNLLNTGPHPLDQALQLFGTDVMPEVFCVMDRVLTFGDAEDYVKLILRGRDRPVIDLEISSCNPYPSFTYNVQGTLGGLKGSTSHLDWKYYLPEEAPEQHLIREPLFTSERTPAYCSETLTWHEDSWDFSPNANLFGTMAEAFYEMLYKTFTTGAPLEITPQQVRQQIAVIEECQRQNPQIYKQL